MPWVPYALAGGGAVLGGLLGLMGSSEQASAAESAADSQAAASRYASDMQYKMWQEQQALMAPWRTSGQNALNELNWQMGLPSGQIPGSAIGQTYTKAPSYIGGQPGLTGLQQNALANTIYNPGKIFNRGQTDDYGGLKSGTVAPTATTGRPFIGGTGNAAAMGTGGSPYVGDRSDYGVLSERFGMDQYQEDPGYQFRLNQGVNALTAAGAAGGYLGSGNLGTALVGYGQEMGSQEYANAYNRYMAENEAAYNRLAAISGTGQLSSQYLAGAGGTAAANMGNLAVGGANALAAGQVGSANAWAGGLNNIGNQAMSGLGTYLNYQQNQNMMNQWALQQGNYWSADPTQSYNLPSM